MNPPGGLILGLSLASLLCGAAAILASTRTRGRRLFIVLKPLTTILILSLAVGSAAGDAGQYAVLIALGLLFSLAGDILLIHPTEYFRHGVLSFTVTHVLYFVAFSLASGFRPVHPFGLLLGGVAALLVKGIWSGVSRRLRIPVLLYALVITATASQAAGAAVALRSVGTTVAAAGALLFFVSDGLLAVDRFRRPLAAGRSAVLSTYWLGQWLIALSTGLPPYIA